MTRAGLFHKSHSWLTVALALTLGAASLVFILGAPVQAVEASAIIRPDGDFTVAAWSDGTSGCSTDSTRWDELVEDPQDGNTTCRATSTAGDVLQLSFENPGSPARVTDIDVFVSITGRVTGGETLTSSFFSGPGCDLEAEQPVPDITSAAYVTATALLERCASTTGSGGIEWTEALVVALRVDVDCVPTGAGLCFITQAYAEVRYTLQDEPGPPPQEPPPPLPEQVQAAAVGVARDLCNLWLLLLLAVIVLVAVVVRHMKRTGGT